MAASAERAQRGTDPSAVVRRDPPTSEVRRPAWASLILRLGVAFRTDHANSIGMKS